MMATKKKKSLRRATKTPTANTHSSPRKKSPAKKPKQPPRKRVSRSSKVTVQTLDVLNERLDIILPEVMFRIAAIEHIMVKNQLCSYEELVNARQFIQEQEQS
ncbi:MAG: hypothetical protein AB7H03_12595 [Nitrospirales bacterium]